SEREDGAGAAVLRARLKRRGLGWRGFFLSRRSGVLAGRGGATIARRTERARADPRRRGERGGRGARWLLGHWGRGRSGGYRRRTTGLGLAAVLRRIRGARRVRRCDSARGRRVILACEPALQAGGQQQSPRPPRPGSESRRRCG